MFSLEHMTAGKYCSQVEARNMVVMTMWTVSGRETYVSIMDEWLLFIAQKKPGRSVREQQTGIANVLKCRCCGWISLFWIL